MKHTGDKGCRLLSSFVQPGIVLWPRELPTRWMVFGTELGFQKLSMQIHQDAVRLQGRGRDVGDLVPKGNMKGMDFDYSARNVLISSNTQQYPYEGVGLIFPAACIVYTFRGLEERNATFSCAFINWHFFSSRRIHFLGIETERQITL